MFKVSCIQLRSNNDIRKNFRKTEYYIKKAVKQKSDFILTPEISSLFSLKKKELLSKANSMRNDFYLREIIKLSNLYKKWILTSVIIKEKNKLKNRSVLINANGAIQNYYDKIHMFDVVLSKKEKYFEKYISKLDKLIKIILTNTINGFDSHIFAKQLQENGYKIINVMHSFTHSFRREKDIDFYECEAPDMTLCLNNSEKKMYKKFLKPIQFKKNDKGFMHWLMVDYQH